MSTHRQRLLHNLPTVETLLGGEARIDSDDLMTSSFSLLFKNIEECAPTGVHDALCQVMVFHHVLYRELLDSDMVIIVSILLSRLLVEIMTLTANLEMSLCRVTSGFASTIAALLTSAHLALFASQSALGGAIKARMGDNVSVAVSQKGLQAHI